MQKKIFYSVACLLLSLSGYSQNWFTDINEAKKEAEIDNKTIVLVFQGSDWCGPCIKLDKNIWSTEEFINYATSNYVMLKADFPKKKANTLSVEQEQKNIGLVERYNQSGNFPLVVLLNKDLQVKGKLGYKNVSPQEYINLINANVK